MTTSALRPEVVQEGLATMSVLAREGRHALRHARNGVAREVADRVI